jgi:16S rRNA (adenine1518-N6/adenine1519-N6)-dimethyltransferase
LQVPEREFVDFLKLSFGQKRKTIANNLKSRYEARVLEAGFRQAGIKPSERAETLPLEKSAALFRALQNGS